MADYWEIYCSDCKRVLGRYNAKYYPEARMGDVIKASHASHVREGHYIEQRRGSGRGPS